MHTYTVDHDDERTTKKTSKKKDDDDKDDGNASGNAAYVAEKEISNLMDVPETLLLDILSFVGHNQYLFVGGTSKKFLELYNKLSAAASAVCPNKTSLVHAASSVSCAEMAMISIYQKAGRNYEKDTLYNEHGLCNSHFIIFEGRILGAWEAMLSAAATCGNFNVLHWIKSRPNCTFTMYQLCWEKYISTDSFPYMNANLEVIKWFYHQVRHKLSNYIKASICKNATEFNRLDIVIWAHSEDFPITFAKGTFDWDYTIPEIAIEHGYLEILKWLKKNVGTELCGSHCELAASCGQLDVLKWLHLKHHVPMISWVCVEAAKHGHFKILKWAVRNGCEMTKYVLKYAEQEGHTELYDWAIANGCPLYNVESDSDSDIDDATNVDIDADIDYDSEYDIDEYNRRYGIDYFDYDSNDY